MPWPKIRHDLLGLLTNGKTMTLVGVYESAEPFAHMTQHPGRVSRRMERERRGRGDGKNQEVETSKEGKGEVEWEGKACRKKRVTGEEKLDK